MKIKHIEIGNFGKLKNYNLSLGNGFQILYGENEDGKTTIMNFLYLMFYGGAKVKTINGIVNIRKKYAPWDGEKMYGALVFEHEKMEYRLEKVFNKSRATDMVTLWNNTTGEKEKLDKGKEIGELVFHMSDSAFEKSVFIACVGSIGSDDDISTKLSNMVTNGDETLSLETTMKRILDARFELISKSKKSGKLVDLEEQISLIKEEKHIAISTEVKRQDLERELQRVSSHLQSLKDKKNKYESNSTLLANQLKYDQITSLIEEIDDLDKSIKGMKIPNIDVELEALGIPITSLNTISMKRLKTYIEELDSLKKEMDSARRLYEEKSNNQEEKATEKSKKKGYLYLILFLGTLSLLLGMFLDPLGYLGLFIVLGIAIVFLVSSKVKRQTYSKEYVEINRRLESFLKEKEGLFLEKVNFFCETKDPHRATMELENQESLYRQLEMKKNKIENKLEAFGWKNTSLKKLVEEKNELESNLLDTSGELLPIISKGEIGIQKENILDIHSEIEETEKKINELIFRQGEIQWGITDVNALEDRDKKLTELQTQMKDYYDVLVIAQEMLEEASHELTSNFSPVVNAKTSQIFEQLTNKKYKSVSVSKDFVARVLESEDIISHESVDLSNGTLDQVYLSLRLAIAELISQDQSRLAIFLDDVLMQYDDKRMEEALRFLYEYGKDKQLLLFTCHGNIVRWCRENQEDIIVRNIRERKRCTNQPIEFRD